MGQGHAASKEGWERARRALGTTSRTPGTGRGSQSERDSRRLIFLTLGQAILVARAQNADPGNRQETSQNTALPCRLVSWRSLPRPGLSPEPPQLPHHSPGTEPPGTHLPQQDTGRVWRAGGLGSNPVPKPHRLIELASLTSPSPPPFPRL